ncbi:MAG TPA: hypothetical protein VMZ03_12225 [Chitinophagaceae bacterium]|nr:hypothetical protein [Chitinophagaceae bacterium]
MQLRPLIIIVLIIVSLLPVYLLYKYLNKIMRPRESLLRFGSWLLTVLVLIFVYTFLLVFLIKLLFPGA